MRGALRPTPTPLPPRVPGAYLALQLPQRLRPGPAARPRRRFLLGEREARCEVSSARRRRRRLLLRGRSGGGESRLAARISHRCPPACPARRPPSPSPPTPSPSAPAPAPPGSAWLRRRPPSWLRGSTRLPVLRPFAPVGNAGRSERVPPVTSAPSGSAGKRSGASTSSREKQLRKHPGPQISSRVAGMRGAAKQDWGGFARGKGRRAGRAPGKAREGGGRGISGFLVFPGCR